MPSGASVETLAWKRSHSAVAAATVGHPADRATVVGPVISAAHRDRVEACVELGRRRAREWSRVAPGPPTWTGVSTGPPPSSAAAPRHAGRPRGDLRTGRGGRPLRRRGGRRRAGQRQRLRPHRLRLVR
ncbi:aldehyde dehydrogenase family protein [Streptomyces badius]